jgi:hypothetical protein
LGKPERLTVAVPEHPFCGASTRLIFALAFCQRETLVGFAVIEKLGGGPEEPLPPPPQLDMMTAKTIMLALVAVIRANMRRVESIAEDA